MKMTELQIYKWKLEHKLSSFYLYIQTQAGGSVGSGQVGRQTDRMTQNQMDGFVREHFLKKALHKVLRVIKKYGQGNWRQKKKFQERLMKHTYRNSSQNKPPKLPCLEQTINVWGLKETNFIGTEVAE